MLCRALPAVLCSWTCWRLAVSYPAAHAGNTCCLFTRHPTACITPGYNPWCVGSPEVACGCTAAEGKFRVPCACAFRIAAKGACKAIETSSLILPPPSSAPIAQRLPSSSPPGKCAMRRTGAVTSMHAWRAPWVCVCCCGGGAHARAHKCAEIGRRRACKHADWVRCC